MTRIYSAFRVLIADLLYACNAKSHVTNGMGFWLILSHTITLILLFRCAHVTQGFDLKMHSVACQLSVKWVFVTFVYQFTPKDKFN